MKLYGYDQDSSHFQSGPSVLAEATLAASPAKLRQIAAFLLGAASRMEQMGSAFSHEHLADIEPGFSESPSFVVAAISEV